MDDLQLDVQVDAPTTESASTDNAVSSTAATTETSVQSSANVTATEESQQAQTTAEQASDPLAGIPTLEELQTQASQNVPYAKALAQLRTAYESVKPQVETFTPWKSVVETIGDPVQAQEAYELAQLIHSRPEGSTDFSEFTTLPFLQKLEERSPGTTDQLFQDVLRLEVDIDGRTDSLARHQFRRWGLDPDRLDDYKNIDALATVASGVVTGEDLAKIDEKFHEGFKALSPSARQDILALTNSENQADRLMAQEHLRNAQAYHEFQQTQEQAAVKAREDQQRVQAELEQTIAAESEAAVEAGTDRIYNSIYQNLAKQVTYSSDEAKNSAQLAGVMGLLYAALDPQGRKLIFDPVAKANGIDINAPVPFEHLTTRFAQATAQAKRFEKMGDQMRAQQALSQATQAENQLLARLNTWALKIGGISGEVAAAQASAQAGALAGATTRFIPNGNGAQSTSGSTNPFESDYEMGSPQWLAHIRQVEAQQRGSRN